MTDAPPGSIGSSGVPRWVWAFVVLVLLLLLMAAVMVLAGGHGPGIHSP